MRPFSFCFCGTPILSDLQDDTANRSCPINMPVIRQHCGGPRRTPRRPPTSLPPRVLTRRKSLLLCMRALLAMDLMHILPRSRVNGEFAFHTISQPTHHHIRVHALVHTHTHTVHIHIHAHAHIARFAQHASHAAYPPQHLAAGTPSCTPTCIIHPPCTPQSAVCLISSIVSLDSSQRLDLLPHTASQHLDVLTLLGLAHPCGQTHAPPAGDTCHVQ